MSNWNKLRGKLQSEPFDDRKDSLSGEKIIISKKNARKVELEIIQQDETSVSSLPERKHPTDDMADEEKAQYSILMRHMKKRAVALDCEMVGLGPSGKQSALARCSIVNFDGEVLYDEYVQPKGFVTDFRTRYSGIRKSDLNKAKAVTLEACQQAVGQLLKGKILVGHALSNDFQAMLVSHPRHMIRDTAFYPFYMRFNHSRQTAGKPRPRALRDLVRQYLGLSIQDRGAEGHDSVEDAKATMLLYRYRLVAWEAYLAKKKEMKRLGKTKTTMGRRKGEDKGEEEGKEEEEEEEEDQEEEEHQEAEKEEDDEEEEKEEDIFLQPPPPTPAVPMPSSSASSSSSSSSSSKPTEGKEGVKSKKKKQPSIPSSSSSSSSAHKDDLTTSIVQQMQANMMIMMKNQQQQQKTKAEAKETQKPLSTIAEEEEEEEGEQSRTINNNSNSNNSSSSNNNHSKKRKRSSSSAEGPVSVEQGQAIDASNLAVFQERAVGEGDDGPRRKKKGKKGRVMVAEKQDMLAIALALATTVKRPSTAAATGDKKPGVISFTTDKQDKAQRQQKKKKLLQRQRKLLKELGVQGQGQGGEQQKTAAAAISSGSLSSSSLLSSSLPSNGSSDGNGYQVKMKKRAMRTKDLK